MKRRDIARSHRNGRLRERGAVLIQVAVAILGLTAFSVLVLDYGVMWVARSQAQNAADSAALAAAVSLAYYDANDISRAKAAGVAAGRANMVFGQEPNIMADDVIIPYDCPLGAPGPPDTCVRVNVFRNQGRDPLPVFFAPLLGIANQGVQAMAVAQVLIAQESDCVKPWAIPDKWDDHREPPNKPSAGWAWDHTFDRYSDNGSARGALLPTPQPLDVYRPPAGEDPGSGFHLGPDGTGGDYGLKVALKFGNPHGAIEPGWFFPVDLPGNCKIGGDCYRENIYGCNGKPIGPGDVIQNEPGNKKGPTDQGVDILVASDPSEWDYTKNAPSCPTGSPACYTKRIISVPVFDIDDFMIRKDYCKNKDNQTDPDCIAQCPTGFPCKADDVNGRFTFKIVKLLGFFIEDIDKNGGGTLIGHFITYPGIFKAGASRYAAFIVPTISGTGPLTRLRVVSDAIIVDARDSAIERMLAACGLRASSLPASQFLALAHPTSAQPEIVVLDLRGDRPLPPAVATLRREHPGTAVLVVASSLDPGLMLEAMRAGVNECVAEPLAQADFEGAVARLLTKRQAARAGLVLAFVGAKGGVGTTTTAVNVAAALTGRGVAQALLIDLHLAHGDAAIFLGAEPRFSVVDALENMHRLDHAFFKSVVTRTKTGPDLLASSERALVAGSAAQGMRRLVEFAAGMYRYSVLDVPHSDPAVWEALDVAAKIVVVANQELACVRNAARVAEALWQRYGKDRVSVLVNRYDPEAEIGQDDIQRVTGLQVCATVPSDYRLALQALNRGRPLTLENHNKLSSSYRLLAEDLAGAEKAAKSAASTGGGGFLGKLLGRG